VGNPVLDPASEKKLRRSKVELALQALGTELQEGKIFQ
jgi:hypothetical protein